MADDDRVKLLPEPNLVHLNLAQQWSIASPFVYRYEDQQWIDQFFETGTIRLSTFAKFSKYQDEVRGDTAEGSGFCYGETPDNKSVGIVQSQGLNALVLCCTHRLSRDMRDKFGRDSAFQIMNTVAFASEISRQLLGFRQGLEGSCIYRDGRTIKRSINFSMKDLEDANGNIELGSLFDIGRALGGAELVLLKDKKYEDQAEYRLMWTVDEIDGDFVDVKAPLARQYCRKVDQSEY